ncbi:MULTISPECIES: hypothetical protein [unclassified Pseudonocardia]|uniref:hypothetical protein n=1 Tax=unclassified Pseudonocardia TaxID=2619320 RepID=UPI00030E73C9|nr:hypothetical protein [Pseudonocardia sp. Ae707_Ps1]OLM18496.1 hypothetical protein Ae707Ps1_2755 [Pseudonocardia sp. Ae707_Ps1]
MRRPGAWVLFFVVVAGFLGLWVWVASPGARPDRAEIEAAVRSHLLARDGVEVTASCEEPAESPDGAYRSGCRLTSADRAGWAAVRLDGRWGGDDRGRPLKQHELARLPSSGEWRITVSGSVPVATGPAGPGAAASGTRVDTETDLRRFSGSSPTVAVTMTVWSALKAGGRDEFVHLECPGDLPAGRAVTCTGTDPVPEATIERLDGTQVRIRAEIAPQAG